MKSPRAVGGQTMLAVLIAAAVVLLLVLGLGAFGVYAGWIRLGTPSGKAVGGKQVDAVDKNTGESKFICEVTISMPQRTLEAEPKVYNDMLVAGVDFDQKTGWYQGDFAISEGHKGSLKVNGTKISVSRPAMFERFGVMIIQEEFTIDRSDGSFVQTLTFRGDKTRHILKGFCGGLTTAPF
jgi:hypothetical protein